MQAGWCRAVHPVCTIASGSVLVLLAACRSSCCGAVEGSAFDTAGTALAMLASLAPKRQDREGMRDGAHMGKGSAGL